MTAVRGQSSPHRAKQRLSAGRARDHPVMEIVPTNKALSLSLSLRGSLSESPGQCFGLWSLEGLLVAPSRRRLGNAPTNRAKKKSSLSKVNGASPHDLRGDAAPCSPCALAPREAAASRSVHKAAQHVLGSALDLQREAAGAGRGVAASTPRLDRRCGPRRAT